MPRNEYHIAESVLQAGAHTLRQLDAKCKAEGIEMPYETATLMVLLAAIRQEEADAKRRIIDRVVIDLVTDDWTDPDGRV